ncbi:MAG: PepSY-like domain-containing protein [Saprospiraceae bacterium]
MKQYFFGALALLSLAFFAACEKDALTGDFTPTTNLAAGDRGGGSDSTAHCMHGDTLDVASLPQAVTDYLAANYPTATVVTAVSKHNGRAYAVELSDGTTLIFKGNGDLLGECGNLPTHPGGPHGPGSEPGGPGNPGGPHGPGHPGGGCLGGDTLTITDLPAGVADYVAANYATTTIQTVVSKRQGLAFAVELSDGTVLIFKADGTFVGTCPDQPGPGNGPHDPGNGPGSPGNGPHDPGNGPGGPGNGPHGGGH